MRQKRQDCYRNLAKRLETTYNILGAETDLGPLEDLRDGLDKSKEELNHAQNKFYDTEEVSHIIDLRNLWNVDLG